MLCNFQEICLPLLKWMMLAEHALLGTCGGGIIASGTEVKPGQPYTQKPNVSRLHISQATLGIGVATNKSTVQCNVGDATPVFICSLFPGREESAQINLEFEEAQQVIFSVLGVRSVHLAGYYVGRGREFDDDLESYGEDVADTETNISEDDDQYEDSFINDGDVEFLPPSPMPNKSAEKEKIKQKKARKGKKRRQRLRKKHEKSISDKVNSLPQQNSEVLLLDSDEEDFKVSSLLKKKSSAEDLEIKVPDVETPLDVIKKEQKQDRSTAVKSTESLSPTVVSVEPGSTAKKMKMKLHVVEVERQNQAWQEDKEPRADDPSEKSSAVEVEKVTSRNCKQSKKKKRKDHSMPHQNPEALSDSEEFFVYSLHKKNCSANDSEIKVPDVVMETPLDVVKNKRKQDGSTAVISSESLSPVVGGEPGSTAKEGKRRLQLMEEEMQNEALLEDKETKGDDPTQNTAKEAKRRLQLMEEEMQNEALLEDKETTADDPTQNTAKEVKRRLQLMEEEMQNEALLEDKETKCDDPTQKSTVEVQQVLSGENCKKSKRKKRKSKLPNGKERRM